MDTLTFVMLYTCVYMCTYIYIHRSVTSVYRDTMFYIGMYIHIYVYMSNTSFFVVLQVTTKLTKTTLYISKLWRGLQL